MASEFCEKTPIFQEGETDYRSVDHVMHKENQDGSNEEGTDSDQVHFDSKAVLYAVNDKPPWGLAFLLGLQHYMAMFGGTVSLPFVIAGFVCVSDKPLIISRIMSSIFMVSGICTTIQVTFGARLPIIQGGTFAFLVPTAALMNLPKWKCPGSSAVNTTTGFTTPTAPFYNEEVDWTDRMREISGAIIAASLIQMIIGFSGLIGILLRFIGPMTIAPTIALVGLVLFQIAADMSGSCWPISLLTVFLIVLFSHGISAVKTPMIFYTKAKGIHLKWIKGIQMFAIILGVAISWSLCAILTVADVLPNDVNSPAYRARTDYRGDVVGQAKWIEFPYPFQWGYPTFSAAGACGMSVAAFVVIIESIGNYYACAALSRAPRPPLEAINRGIGVEGIGCLIAGIIGSGNGTTSYSENVAAVGLTKVASRRVIHCGAILMMVLAVFGKFGALFTTIPAPVIGGSYIVLFGMIFSVGISTLRSADMTSQRNMMVLGVSFMMGMVVPFWVRKNPRAIDSGSEQFDQVVTVLLTTEMGVGCIIALIMDNLLPGTLRERGMHVDQSDEEDVDNGKRSHQTDDCSVAAVYDMSWPIQGFLNKHPITRKIPFFTFRGDSHVASNDRTNSVNDA